MGGQRWWRWGGESLYPIEGTDICCVVSAHIEQEEVMFFLRVDRSSGLPSFQHFPALSTVLHNQLALSNTRLTGRTWDRLEKYCTH